MALARSLKQWADCSPRAMATEQSPEAICHAFMDAKNDIRTLAEQRDALAAALRTIADGMTSNYPGAPDVMNAASPEHFRADMWTWSQKVARAALGVVS